MIMEQVRKRVFGGESSIKNMYQYEMDESENRDGTDLDRIVDDTINNI